MATLTCGAGGTYATLAAALAAASADDTIEIQAGTYNGAGWTAVVISTRVTIDGLGVATIELASGTALTLSAAGTTVKRLAIESASSSVAITVGATGCTLEDMYISCSHASGEAVACSTADANISILTCVIENTSGASTTYGVQVSGTGVMGRIIGGSITGYAQGINTNAAAQTSGIVRAVVLSNAINIRYPANWTISQCVLLDATDSIYGGVGTSAVYMCTFDGNTDAMHATAASNFLVANNIFQNNTTCLRGQAGDEAQPVNNIFYNNGTKYTNYTAGAGDIDADPLLDVDYVPGEGSPALDAASALYVDAYDLYHPLASWRPQGSGYDIGAVERESTLPPEPPTPLTGRRFEVHRIWPGGPVGTVTIGATEYSVTLARVQSHGHALATALRAALEAATGVAWTAWLSPELALVAGCGQVFEWEGTTAWNAWAGWEDGESEAAPDRGYQIAGTVGTMAQRLCAVRLSWPIMRVHRVVCVSPAASPPLTAAYLGDFELDFDVDAIAPPEATVHMWMGEDWVLYRGYDSPAVGAADTDGYLVLRPTATPQQAAPLITDYAGVVVTKSRCTWVTS